MKIDCSVEPYLVNGKSILDNTDDSIYKELARHYKGMDRGYLDPALFEIKKEITFFAGSFNPWHDGHHECVVKHGIKNLLIAPDYNPQKNTQFVSIHETIKGIYLSLKDDGLKFSQIYPGFIAKGEANPTIIWVRKLLKVDPKLKINLLMGFDSFMQMHFWISADELLRSLNKLFVVSRKDEPQNRDEQVNRLQLIAPHLHIEFLGNHPHEHLSSTELRSKISPK